MCAATADAPPARLKTRYFEEIRPTLIERFEYSSVMQAPRVQKITLNMGVGMAKQDSKVLKAATEQLATIAGQQPSVRRARKSIAAFKLREGMPVGVAVTLRGERAYEFLDRLVSVAIPRIRDFRGLNPRSFDGRGNYSMGVREQIIFPEIDYDAIDQVRGMDITISTSAASDAEAYALLQALGMPFAAQGRPKGFDPAADEAEAEARAAAYAAETAQKAGRGASRRERAAGRRARGLRRDGPERHFSRARGGRRGSRGGRARGAGRGAGDRGRRAGRARGGGR
jgi:large subunit ribosomal protein L5